MIRQNLKIYKKNTSSIAGTGLFNALLITKEKGSFDSLKAPPPSTLPQSWVCSLSQYLYTTNETLGTNGTFFLFLVCFVFYCLFRSAGVQQKTASEKTIHSFKCCAQLIERLEPGDYF